MAAYYYFGEVEDIRATITERDGVTCTLNSGTVSIKTAAGVAIRDDVACSVDDTTSPKSIWFHETFSTANGYAEDTDYVATFKASVTRGATSYTPKPVVPFRVLAVEDEP
jgi:hypothetical protein